MYKNEISISDIHIEFSQSPILSSPEPRLNFLFLVGDIGIPSKDEKYEKFLLDCASKFEKVFVIAGNHEYYTSEYHFVNEKIQQTPKF